MKLWDFRMNSKSAIKLSFGAFKILIKVSYSKTFEISIKQKKIVKFKYVINLIFLINHTKIQIQVLFFKILMYIIIENTKKN